MNVDKAKKRIAKRVNNGFKGYPQDTISYSGKTSTMATQVSISYQENQDSEVQVQKFSSENEIRDDEVIQSVLLKIIERSDAATVVEEKQVKLRPTAE